MIDKTGILPFEGEEKLFQYLQFNSYRSEQHRIYYVATPKVACTSLKWWFAELEGYTQAILDDKSSAESDPELTIHDTFYKVAPSVTGLSSQALMDVIGSESYFRFAVVRNPFKRIFSAWQSKLFLQEPLQIGPYVDFEFFKRPIQSKQDMALAFEGFLDQVAKREAPNFWDVHWTPQVNLLRPDLIQYTSLVQIESPKALRESLAIWMGDDFVDPLSARSANESLIPFLPELITPRSAELIREIYREDFVQFGYDEAVPDAKENFSQDQFETALKAVSIIRARHRRLADLARRNKELLQEEQRLFEIVQVVEVREKEIAEIRDSLIERDERIANLEAQHLNLGMDHSNLEAQHSNLESQLVNLEAQHANLEAQHANLEAQLASLETHLSDISNYRVMRLARLIAKIRSYLGRGKRKLLRGVNSLLSHFAGRETPEKTNEDRLVQQNDDRLSQQFDHQLYLELYPDIAAAGVDPAEHFYSHGRSEGRIGLVQGINKDALLANISERETVLVVGHEASLTGAPVLTLNFVEHLKDRYNVIVLLFGSGPLVSLLKDKCAMVIEAEYARPYSIAAERIIASICEAVDLKFAIVNSVAARAALPGLKRLGVPSLFLAHEFAADTFPKGSFRAAIRHADATIFSTNITYQNLLSTHPDLARTPVHIIPQGQCKIPFLGNHEVSGSSERERLSAAIFGKGESEKKFTVLGAGSVCYRKGVDLFVSCALRAKQLCVDVDFRFVWIGKGFFPESDQFSAFLADQIERSELKDDLVIIDETTEISFAYENADVFLLTSRLDPLPNVAIDVMGFGSPVLCFDKTTGVVDFLQKSGVASECVSPYLNVEDMANKLAHLARTHGARDKIAQSFLPCWRETFDFDKYISRLMNVYESIESRVSARQVDMVVIRDSGLYVMEFSDPEGVGCRSVDESIDRYLRTWEKDFEFETRKPFPGFHPGIFAEQTSGSLEGDPLAKYIRSGMPEGAWLTTVISAKGKEVSQWTLPSPSQVALHIHAYYPDLLPQILSALMCNRIRPDLFISVPSEIAKVTVYRHIQHYTEGKVVIEVVPNKGRDIGPFFSAFADSLRKYEFIGHLHTKRSLHVSDSSIVERWFDFLISNLLGDAEHLMLDRILDTFVRDEQLGMVFPDDPNACGWTLNRKIAEEFAPRLGIGALPSSFNFPIGTMFWARTNALAPFFDLELDWADYPEEPLPIDGTMLHAIERLLPLGLAAPSQKVAVTHVPGVTR